MNQSKSISFSLTPVIVVGSVVWPFAEFFRYSGGPALEIFSTVVVWFCVLAFFAASFFVHRFGTMMTPDVVKLEAPDPSSPSHGLIKKYTVDGNRFHYKRVKLAVFAMLFVTTVSTFSMYILNGSWYAMGITGLSMALMYTGITHATNVYKSVIDVYFDDLENSKNGN